MSTLSRVLRAIALVVLALGVLPVGSGPAAAHAALVSSDPRDGARLERLPDRVSLTFTEEVSAPAYVVVRAPDGRQLASGDPDVAGATVSQALDGSDVSGAVTVAYRVVSVDGHAVTGEVAVTVSPPTSWPSAEPSAGSPAEPSAEFSAESSAESSAAPTDEPPTDPDTAASGDASPAVTDAASAAAAAEPEGFWATHGSHYVLGGFLVLVAGGLLWLARGRESP